MTQNLLQKLKSLLQPAPVDPAHCVQLQVTNLRWPPGGRRGAGAVLGRGLLLYRWLELGNVPAAQQRAAVKAQLQAWSPFEQAGYCAVWLPGGAGLFAWDAGRVQARLTEAGVPADAVQPVFPESWLMPPLEEGIRLLRCAEGFEGQVWKDRGLRASRWWQELPDENEWLNFQRGGSVAPEALRQRDAALQEALPWVPGGWGPLVQEAELSGGASWEPMVLALGSLGLMIATATISHDYWLIHGEEARLKTEASRLESVTQPALAARETALAELPRLVALSGAMQGPAPLEVLDYLLKRLPKDGTLIRELEIAEGGKLRLALTVPPNTSRQTIVGGLAAGEWLDDVREAKGSTATEVVLSMVLKGAVPPALEGKLAPAGNAAPGAAGGQKS